MINAARIPGINLQDPSETLTILNIFEIAGIPGLTKLVIMGEAFIFITCFRGYDLGPIGSFFASISSYKLNVAKDWIFR